MNSGKTWGSVSVLKAPENSSTIGTFAVEDAGCLIKAKEDIDKDLDNWVLNGMEGEEELWCEDITGVQRWRRLWWYTNEVDSVPPFFRYEESQWTESRQSSARTTQNWLHRTIVPKSESWILYQHVVSRIPASYPEDSYLTLHCCVCLRFFGYNHLVIARMVSNRLLNLLTHAANVLHIETTKCSFRRTTLILQQLYMT